MRFLYQPVIVFTFIFNGCGSGGDGTSRDKLEKPLEKENLQNSNQVPVGETSRFSDDETDGIDSVCDNIESQSASVVCEQLREYQREIDRDPKPWKPTITSKSQDEIMGEFGQYEIKPFQDFREKRTLKRFLGINDSTDPKKMIITYQIECLKISCSDVNDGGISPDCDERVFAQSDSLATEFVLTRFAAEHELAPKVYTISASIVKKKGELSGTRLADANCPGKSRVRAMGSELAETSVMDCLVSIHRGITKERFADATRIFIRLIKLLKKFHDLGIVVGDIDSRNLGFVGEKEACDTPNFFRDGNNLEKIIVLNLNQAKYFVKDDLFSGPNQPVDVVTASPWELQEDQPVGPRDDVFRAFETYLDMVTGGEISKFFSAFASIYQHDDKGQIIAILKTKMDMLMTMQDQSRFNAVFSGSISDLGNPVKIVALVNSYAGFSHAQQAVASVIDDVLTPLRVISKYVREIESSKVVPDYDLIITQAEKIDKKLNSHH